MQIQCSARVTDCKCLPFLKETLDSYGVTHTPAKGPVESPKGWCLAPGSLSSQICYLRLEQCFPSLKSRESVGESASWHFPRVRRRGRHSVESLRLSAAHFHVMCPCRLCVCGCLVACSRCDLSFQVQVWKHLTFCTMPRPPLEGHLCARVLRAQGCKPCRRTPWWSYFVSSSEFPSPVAQCTGLQKVSTHGDASFRSVKSRLLKPKTGWLVWMPTLHYLLDS